MEKAGLKTFVYSFVFSLFVLFSANSVYLRSKTTSHNIKISNKNVTLFLKNLPQATPQAYAVPTKKIALSVISDIPSTKRKTAQPTIPLESKEILIEPSPQPSESNTIPLEGSFASKKKISNEAPILLADATFDKAEIIPEKQKEITIPSLADAPEASSANMSEEDDIAFEPFENITDDIIITDNTSSTNNIDDIENKDAEPLPLPLITQEEDHTIPIEKENGIIRTANKTIEIVNTPSGNQVALKSDNIPIKSMTETTSSAKESENTSKEWQQMSEKKKDSADDAWLVAKSRSSQNNLIAKNDSYKKSNDEIKQLLSAEVPQTPQDYKLIELAAETPKNLLIPIPEEILKDENLTPQLTSSPENKAIEEKLHNESDENRFKDDYIDTPTEGKKGLLDSLTSIFSNKDQSTPEIGDAIEDDSKGLFSAFRTKRSRSKNNTKILPTEMRLSFQPNRAEISGQTLRWIRAFANKTRQEKSIGLEIRIDGTSAPLLQQRRLNLLQNILLKEDVDYRKVKTVFTAREPNSFIIRTIRIIPKAESPAPPRKQRNNEQYLQW